MHTTFARGAGVVGATFALTLVFGTGTAGATNDYAGQTYNDAANAIASSGNTPKISTRFGTFLPTGACIVSGSRTLSSANGPSGVVLLDLNCNYMFALPGVPGNSMGKEAGRTARSAAEEQYAAQQAEAKAKAEAEAEAAAAEQKDISEGG